MTYKPPPESGRFKKGQSGHPLGRPKKIPQLPLSPFEIVLSETVTVLQAGVQRELTLEEAVEFRLLQDAIAGKKMAQRAIMKMIEKRNAARIEKAKASRPNANILVRTEFDPRNADRALIILDIASVENGWAFEALKLNRWAVQIALSRWRGRPKPNADEMRSIKSGTRDSEKLRWPRRWDHE